MPHWTLLDSSLFGPDGPWSLDVGDSSGDFHGFLFLRSYGDIVISKSDSTARSNKCLCPTEVLVWSSRCCHKRCVNREPPPGLKV
eukprot:4727705-Amphidinium_carterae.1